MLRREKETSEAVKLQLRKMEFNQALGPAWSPPRRLFFSFWNLNQVFFFSFLIAVRLNLGWSPLKRRGGGSPKRDKMETDTYHHLGPPSN